MPAYWDLRIYQIKILCAKKNDFIKNLKQFDLSINQQV